MSVHFAATAFRPQWAVLMLALLCGLSGPAWADKTEETAAAAQEVQAAAQTPASEAASTSTDASDDAADTAQADATPPAAPSEEDIKAAIQQRFLARFSGLSVGDVASTPFAGVYEIPVQGELLYTDASGRYVLQGSMIDLDTRTDLTAERMAKLTAVDFDKLPLASAIKQVRGNGEHKIVIFEDPNCGYCKQFHRTLENFDNITIYSVMFPILAPDSRQKSEHIMCAKDPVAALRGWMLEGKVPPKANCDTDIDGLLAFGKQHNVRGTPAVFFEDGTRVGGAMNAEQLTQRLAAIKKP